MVARATRTWSSSETGKPFPQDPEEQLWGAIGAVFGSLDEPPRDHLSPAARHPRRMGHRGERAGHGVRQHGQRLRHRRVLHPRSVHRRERVLRRVPGERAGRGRGGRHPHAAAGVEARAPSRTRRRWKRRCRRPTPNCCRCARRWSSTTTTCRTWNSRCSRTSSTCCRRATASAPPRRSLRIAVDMAREGLIDQAEAVRRVNPTALDQLLHPTLDPEGAAHPAGEGTAGQPGRRLRRRRVHRRRGGKPRAEGRGGHPGAHRDQPGGHPRHARRPRHPDHARRHDQPRRGGGARHGPALRRRRRRHRGRLQRADAVGRRARPCAPAKPSRSMAPPARCSSAPSR